MPLFTKLVLLISQSSSAQQTIANAHMIFNISGVLIMIPFLHLYEKALNFLIFEKKLAGQSLKVAGSVKAAQKAQEN